MRALACLAIVFTSCAPAALPSSPSGPTAASAGAAPVMVGTLSRAMIASIPGWTSEGLIDVAAAKKLATVPPGAEVTVILGTWCSDSKRELSRMWQALDVAGAVPFTVALIGVGRDKKVTPELTVDYVPLVIVRRGGKEVGRIIESAPNGIERDLLGLLEGSTSGAISGRVEPARP